MRTHLFNYALFLLLSLTSAYVLAQSEPSFPILSGQVIDQAGLLDTATQSELTKQLLAHEEQTTNQIVVVTLRSLQGFDEADYALRLGRKWGLGTEENNNGVILLVAPNERKVRIEVGYGLEGAIPDALAGQIIGRNILPAFKKNDYPAGITSGVNAILQAAAGEYKATPSSNKRRNKRDGKTFDFIPLFFIGMVAVPALMRRRGLKRLANASFPGGFAGIFSTVLSGNLIVGVIVGLAAFAGIYFFGHLIDDANGRGPNDRHRGGSGSGGSNGGFSGRSGGSSHRGGGGFSGGGGSFGGGGASGGW